MAFNPTLRHLTTRLDGGVVWAASTEYLADNIVIYLDASYRCLVNHTSGSSFVTDLLANKWVKLSASVVNYIANSSALVDTSGYSAYADAAGTAPVDGTGGSPSVTFARSTTTPLRGIADFNFTKPAGASYQGNGVSYDFTIDNADLAKVLSVTFDYEVVSGTYSDGDLTVYLIQDPTGTPTVIQPAGYTILSGTAGTKLTQNATFQTASNVTSYRLCFHCASSTNTSAYVIAMDNISVSPQRTVQGAAISDWVQYSPAASFVGFGTVSATNMWSRRVGDSLEVLGTFTSGTPTATTAQIPLGFGRSTGNVTVDASKAASGIALGVTPLSGSSTTNSTYHFLSAGAQSYVNMAIQGDTNSGIVAAAGSTLTGAGATLRVHFRVPIQGWSSNTVMSQDTDTRVVAALYNGTPTGTLSGSNNDVTFPTKISDTHSFVSGSSVTIPVSGFYSISASALISGTYSVGNYALLAIAIDTVEKYRNVQVAGGAISALYPAVVVNSIYLNAGQVVKIQSNTNATSPSFASSTANQFSISRLSGPATIAASETVAMLYTGAPPTGSIGAALNTVTMGTRVTDSHSAYSGGVYTVPVSGRYSIAGSIATSATFSSGNLSTCSIIIDNIEKYSNYFEAETGPTVRSPCVQVSVHSIPLLAGQTIRLGCFINAGSPVYSSAATVNYLSIIRVGN